MKYIGLAILVLGAYMILRAYGSHQMRRLALADEVLELLRHVRIKMTCFLSSSLEACRGFDAPILSELGFFSAVAECGTLSGGFEAVREKMPLDGNIKELLFDTFAAIGEGYLKDGVERIDAATMALEKHLAALSVQTKSNSRAAYAVGTAIILGLVILLL